MIRVVGVDGWKKKWVAVFLEDGRFTGLEVYETLQSISELPLPKVIGVDVPIGLTEQLSRTADQMARQVLGPRRSSVFNAPPAFALDPEWTSYQKTNEESKRRYGKGLSAQGFALMKNVQEADTIAKSDERFFEVHPEVSFWKMNRKRTLNFPKKSWNGQADRLALLRTEGIEIPRTFPVESHGRISPDDILDAAAAAWSANRIASQTAEAFPDTNRRVERIWF